MAIVYRTADLAAKDRFPYWHEVMCRHFLPAHSEAASRKAFNARFSMRMLGATSVSEISAPAHTWTRNAEHLRRAPHDEFLLSLMLDGEGCLSQDGREVRQRPGTMVLYDTGRAYRYRLAADVIVLKIPRRLLLARTPAAERLTAVPLRADSPLGALAAGLIRQAPGLELAAHAPRIGSSILDVLAAALDTEACGRRGAGSKQLTLLEEIQTCMLAKLDDPDLDVASVARTRGISPRSLNRLFASSGTTPMRWLWRQRLEASWCWLREGRARRVTDVAFSLGFSDLSHFSRAFKNAYGVSPQSLIRSRN